MNIKKNLRNVLVSFLFLILLDVIYFGLDMFTLDYIKTNPVLAVINIALFGGFLYIGYIIGQKLLSEVKRRLVSIVIIPLIMILMIYGIGILGNFDITMIIHFPARFLFEPFAELLPESIVMSNFFTILFICIEILYYLLCCLSLLIGSYHKKQK